jgi:hypothetical protein
VAWFAEGGKRGLKSSQAPQKGRLTEDEEDAGRINQR